MDTELMLDVGQANELKLAFRRCGYTNADVKKLSERDILGKLLSVLRGQANIVAVKHIINCDVDPYLPRDWKVEEHTTRRGQFEFDPTKIILHLDEEQQIGGVIAGNKLREKLKGKPVLNANVLDYLLANPGLIPEEWKEKFIFFWGTIYRDLRDGLCVRCLDWDGDGWVWSYFWLGDGFRDDNPCAALASS